MAPSTRLRVRAMSNHSEDYNIVRRAMKGSGTDALAVIRMIEAVINFTLRRTPLDPRDVVHAAMVKVQEGFESFDPNGKASINTWIHTIAKNTAIDYLRAWDRDRAMFAIDSPSESKAAMVAYEGVHDAAHVEHVEDQRLGEEALAMVPFLYSEVLELRLTGLSDREIARRRGISEKTVRSRASRGISMARESLRQIYGSASNAKKRSGT